MRVPLPDPRKISKTLEAQLARIAAGAVDASNRPESEWHISARIIFPAPGKSMGLTGQSEELKAVLRGCIDFIKLSLLFQDSYPAIISRAGFARTYLIAAANTPASIHIKQRLETDLSFAARLADIVCTSLYSTLNLLFIGISPWIVSTSPGEISSVSRRKILPASTGLHYFLHRTSKPSSTTLSKITDTSSPLIPSPCVLNSAAAYGLYLTFFRIV